MLHRARFATLATFAAVTLGAAACADAPTTPAGTPALSDAPSLNRAAPQPSVAKLEIDYMQETIDHHLAGIMMAQMCIQKAVHEELRQLCRESLASQQRQIALYRTWLQEWYGISYTGEIPQSAEQDIERLSALSGAEFEDEFLEEFSKHHLMIIKQSEHVVRRAYHEELRREARMTIVNQSRQVIMMQTWDCAWYGDCPQGLKEQAERFLQEYA
jgi:uncharacterized protein (DUF305 family)